MADELQLQFPAATAKECERFWKSFGSDAGRLLGEYLEFKTNAERQLASSDGKDPLWVQCMKAALVDHPIEAEPIPVESSSIFDPILFVPTTPEGKLVRCAEGKPILYVAPARVNFDLYPPALYTACILLFCYKSFQEEPFTVLVDVRAGRGWPNMPITRMYGWLRSCSGELSNLFPNALYKCIVFTVPFVAKALWYVVQPLLSTKITESLVLVNGSGTSYTTPLPEDMYQHVQREDLQPIEDKRRSWYVPTESRSADS